MRLSPPRIALICLASRSDVQICWCWMRIWTSAVETGDDAAHQLGNRMLGLIAGIRESSEQLPEILLHARQPLNAAWPTLRSQRISDEEAAALDQYLAEYGGLGDAAYALATGLNETLADESCLVEEEDSRVARSSRHRGGSRTPCPPGYRRTPDCNRRYGG